jgi:hypothetical protein
MAHPTRRRRCPSTWWPRGPAASRTGAPASRCTRARAVLRRAHRCDACGVLPQKVENSTRMWDHGTRQHPVVPHAPGHGTRDTVPQKIENSTRVWDHGIRSLPQKIGVSHSSPREEVRLSLSKRTVADATARRKRNSEVARTSHAPVGAQMSEMTVQKYVFPSPLGPNTGNVCGIVYCI